MLVSEASTVYTNDAYPGKYVYLVGLKMILVDWQDSPVELLMVSGILSEDCHLASS